MLLTSSARQFYLSKRTCRAGQIDPGETDPIAERRYFSLCFVVVVEIEQHAPSAVGPPAKTSARRGSQADFERILGPVAARTSRDGRLTVPHSKITPRRSAKLRLWPASLGTAGRPACASKRWPARRLGPGKSQEIQEGPPCHTARWARSACVASAFSSAKNALDWPVKSPLAVRKRTAPIAAPCVSVGRTIEQTGKLRLRKTVGSGGWLGGLRSPRMAALRGPETRARWWDRSPQARCPPCRARPGSAGPPSDRC